MNEQKIPVQIFKPFFGPRLEPLLPVQCPFHPHPHTLFVTCRDHRRQPVVSWDRLWSWTRYLSSLDWSNKNIPNKYILVMSFLHLFSTVFYYTTFSAEKYQVLSSIQKWYLLIFDFRLFNVKNMLLCRKSEYFPFKLVYYIVKRIIL